VRCQDSHIYLDTQLTNADYGLDKEQSEFESPYGTSLYRLDRLRGPPSLLYDGYGVKRPESASELY
jgi:hypothetical protein